MGRKESNETNKQTNNMYFVTKESASMCMYIPLVLIQFSVFIWIQIHFFLNNSISIF